MWATTQAPALSRTGAWAHLTFACQFEEVDVCHRLKIRLALLLSNKRANSKAWLTV
jgi:hypothetical protein